MAILNRLGQIVIGEAKANVKKMVKLLESVGNAVNEAFSTELQLLLQVFVNKKLRTKNFVNKETKKVSNDKFSRCFNCFFYVEKLSQAQRFWKRSTVFPRSLQLL